MPHSDLPTYVGLNNEAEVTSIQITSTYLLNSTENTPNLVDRCCAVLKQHEVLRSGPTSIRFQFISDGQTYSGDISFNEVGANHRPEEIDLIHQRRSDRIRLKIESDTLVPRMQSGGLESLLSVESNLSELLDPIWDERGNLSLTLRFDRPVTDSVERLRDSNGRRLELFHNNLRIGSLDSDQLESAASYICTILKKGSFEEFN